MNSEISKLLSKADYLRSIKRWQQAIEVYQSALEFAYSQEEIFYRIGQCYYALGQFNKAIEYGSKVISIKPDVCFPYHLLALAYFALGQTKKAETLEKKALAISPNEPHYHWLLAKIYNSRIGFFRKREAKKALNHALQGLRFNPSHTRCLIEKNNALMTLGYTKELNRNKFDVIQSAPNSADALENLGDIYTSMGNHGEARKYFKEALRLEPTNSQLIVKSKFSKWDTIISGVIIAFSFAASQILRACISE